MLFFLRKLVGIAVTPSVVVVAMLLLGTLLLCFERTWKWGRRLVAAGVVVLLFLAYGVPFDRIGQWLEGRYPAVLVPAQLPEAGAIRWVVVLGGGHRADAFLPPSAQPSEESLYRIVEGVRLHEALPESRLLFSGYGAQDSISSARVGAGLAGTLGVSADRMVLEEAPRTTAEEAVQIRARIGDEPFLLVTSAFHMPRAVRLFEQAGLSPIPAPTGHRAFDSRRWQLDWFIPSPRRIVNGDAVMHELVGLLAVRLGVQ